jgi:hypothetical protein
MTATSADGGTSCEGWASTSTDTPPPIPTATLAASRLESGLCSEAEPTGHPC